ncbi:hypothetical protein RZS28_11155 [Methylocapsa polymorpha]|uniref:Transposase n=1 Tax=Methylocapsa polymorpha TaxID=3080828 RepID=A0ABZ0HMK8_9HYPH|nr:hypothetical protein RZS28_11155 [Methylocapsa sp. RX1]
MTKHRSTTRDAYEANKSVAVSALPDALPELVFAILAPLYELFDFSNFQSRFSKKSWRYFARARFEA